MFFDSLLTDCGQVTEDFPRGDATEPVWSGTVHANGLNIFLVLRCFCGSILFFSDDCFLVANYLNFRPRILAYTLRSCKLNFSN